VLQKRVAKVIKWVAAVFGRLPKRVPFIDWSEIKPISSKTGNFVRAKNVRTFN
jgi:hypothetical protein